MVQSMSGTLIKHLIFSLRGKHPKWYINNLMEQGYHYVVERNIFLRNVLVDVGLNLVL